jgi:hypothetical protein
LLPIEEHTEQAAAGAPDEDARRGELLTGDLGVVVLRALLECGVGYVVSSWRDRPTPIDAAIDDARDRVLAARGVVLRRLRSLSALEPIVTAPTGGVTGEPPRGAVVFGGRRGLRPALEQFVQVRCSGGVVGFTFDEDALRIRGALVIDPDPTAPGLAHAIEAAFVASVASGRPALVVVRERALGMRGTMRTRDAVHPTDAARADAQVRGDEQLAVEAAACAAGLVVGSTGSAAGAVRRAILVLGPMRVATERALAQVAALHEDVDVDDVAIVASRAVGIVPDPQHATGAALRDADSVLVLGVGAAQAAQELAATGVQVDGEHALDPGALRGEQVEQAIATWLLGAEPEAAPTPPRVDADVAMRLPRRGDVLHRSVSPTVAAGLVLAQGVMGVPARIDEAYPTYRTDTGVPLTVAPAATFAEHGIGGCVAPGSGTGVVLVVGPTVGGVIEAAGAAGASVEMVDGSSPRAIGRAIATACRQPRATWHVIVVGEVQRVAAPRASTFGMDPDLVGTERLATSAVPTAATVLVTLDDELVDGPSVLALDRPEAHAALDQVRDLSPATWDLRRRPARGRAAGAAWNLRRRLLRSIAGVEL